MMYLCPFRCDGVVDCPGSLHEDESEDCTREAIQASCRDWKLVGSTATGKYPINPEGLGKLKTFLSIIYYLTRIRPSPTFACSFDGHGLLKLEQVHVASFCLLL